MFHLQQCVEKFLKAALSHRGIEISRTHDIERLITLCQESGVILPDYIDSFVDLSLFAVEGRYALIHDDMCDAENFLKEAKHLQAFIGSLIGSV
jgi:HEPN domain-containing protein